MKLDKSWKPLFPILHREPFTGFQEVLNNISYEPSKEEIFKPYEIPLENIEAVFIFSGYNKVSNAGNILRLNTTLTRETGKDHRIHEKYWSPFIESTIRFISFTKPCIWIIPTGLSSKIVPYIRYPYFINRYDEDTIKEVPLNPDNNYIQYVSSFEEFISQSKKINILLEKQGKNGRL